ncbi:MAG TPA: hypothetical protein VIP11_06470 [Gemmatimonadaceae bacterium]
MKQTLIAVLAVFLGAARAGAQVPILLEGVADGELWSTTNGSNLLTRSFGRPGGVGRVQLWGAVEPFERLVIYGQVDVEGGPARASFVENAYHANMNQFAARYTVARALVVDAGQVTPILGTFATRRFSTRNPLIGSPDGYALDYPVGVVVSGETKHFDYRAAMVDLPATHRGYTPTPSRHLRPAGGVGYTPIVGVRIGGSFTVGPYLYRDLTADQLRGEPWTKYKQRVVAADLAIARGYLETHFEAARGSYDVPGRAAPTFGYTYYGEAKYTLTPRFFVAGRAERNKYPFIRPNATGTWSSRLTDFVDGELGAGYRLTKSTLVKASVRGDRWWVAYGATGFRGQGGRAFALQVSQAFDVVGWFDRAR